MHYIELVFSLFVVENWWFNIVGRYVFQKKIKAVCSNSFECAGVASEQVSAQICCCCRVDSCFVALLCFSLLVIFSYDGKPQILPYTASQVCWCRDQENGTLHFRSKQHNNTT